MAHDRRISEETRQILDPVPELPRLYPLRIILRILEDAEDLVGEVLCDGASHACEALHEEIDGSYTVQIEGITSPMGGILPWVIMIEPGNNNKMSKYSQMTRNGQTHMLISTIPSDQTSAARGL